MGPCYYTALEALDTPKPLAGACTTPSQSPHQKPLHTMDVGEVLLLPITL